MTKELESIDTQLSSNPNIRCYVKGINIIPELSGFSVDELGDAMIRDGADLRPDKHPTVYSIMKQTFPDKLPKLNVYSCAMVMGITKDNDLFVRCYPFELDTGRFIINGEFIEYDTYEVYLESFMKLKKR